MIGKIFFLIAAFFTVYVLINVNKAHASSIASIAKKQSQIIGYHELSSGAIGRVQASSDELRNLILDQMSPYTSSYLDNPEILYQVIQAQTVGRGSTWFDEYRFGTTNSDEQLKRMTDSQVREILAHDVPTSRWCEGWGCKGEKTEKELGYIIGVTP